ncbi:MAG TPA: hypothetical protein VF331_04190 [Polyangiales bacterium]
MTNPSGASSRALGQRLLHVGRSMCCCAFFAVGVTACSTSGRLARGGSGDLDGGVDTAAAAGAIIGGACKKSADCPKGTLCDVPIPNSVTVRGAPGGKVEFPLFPGGSCTPHPIAPYAPDGGTSCDPLQAASQSGCGKNGVCVVDTVGGNTLVDCRVQCTPSNQASGCARSGYTCDFGIHACVEGCQSDAECRLVSVDNTGDGVADALSYDPTSKAVCDAKTGRCGHTGTGGSTGTTCKRQDDCEPDGTCIAPLSTLAGLHFPGGFCTKFGCDVAGRSCPGSKVVCESLRPWNGSSSSAPACLSSCTVGAEPSAQRLGVAGHGTDCRTGYRCHYNGGLDATDGVCVGGNYNAVTKNNVGAGCKTDDECYSPFGFGRCLTLAVGIVSGSSGVCAIMDCAAPGLPADVCGTHNECIGLSGDLTFCVHDCSTAADCAAGDACADDDGDPATVTICYPACSADKECRAGKETCSIPSGATRGQCVAK